MSKYFIDKQLRIDNNSTQFCQEKKLQRLG